MLLHDAVEEGQPVHPGHLDVEDDDVRDLLRDLLGGDQGIGGGPHDLELGVTRQYLPQYLPNGGRVIHDEHPDHRALTFR